MGAYAPVPWVTDVAEHVERLIKPVIDELARRDAPFAGCLFAGLILTADGPKVLEFNARFGDPETQVLMPRLDGDLLEALAGAARGDLSGITLGATRDAAVTVVLAAPDYPDRSDYAGLAIDGLDEAEASGALVFHSGTAARSGRIVTNGGRILSVTAVGPTLFEARSSAYAAVDLISFEGAQFRSDIAGVARA
jgi:phosphoribosylamine--glycine ligase